MGRTGGEPGGEAEENRGCPKEPGENRGHLGREPGGNRGLLVLICKEYRGRSGGFGTRTGENRGEGIFFETRDPTRDLKIINSVQTRCIVKGEAQKSPLFWRFSGAFDFLRIACSLRIPQENL